MRNFIIKFFILSLVFFGELSFAQSSAFSCSPVKVTLQGKGIVLNKEIEGSKIYLFKNTSSKSIWLDHPTKRGGVSAGWSSYLQPGNWSALLSNKKEFELTCAVIQPGKVDYISCGKSLSVCSPSHMGVNSNRKVSYWLVEDKPWDSFLAALKKRVK